MSKRSRKKLLSILLAFVMVLTFMPAQTIRAEGEPANITAENYVEDYYSVGEGTYGTIIVPAGYNLDVNSGAVTASKLIIESGATVHVFTADESAVTPVTLTFGESELADGAIIEFGSGANVPEGMTLYNEDGTDVIDASTIEWNKFIYNGEKWCLTMGEDGPGSEYFELWVDGLQESDSFKMESLGTDGSTWNSVIFDEEGVGFCVDMATVAPPVAATDPDTGAPIVDENENPIMHQYVTLRFSIDDPASAEVAKKIIAYAQLGIDEEGNPICDLEDGGEDGTSGPKTYFSASIDDSDAPNGVCRDSLTFTIDLLEDQPHDLHIALCYPNEGYMGIVDEVKNYMFAYACADATEAKEKLAEELYERYIRVAMFERFGFGILEADGEAYTDEVRTANIAELEGRIAFSGAASVMLKNKAGSPVTRTCYRYDVNWGTDRDTGLPVVSEGIYVFVLNDPDEFIVCTDWNNETGYASDSAEFFVREAHTDCDELYADETDENYIFNLASYGNVLAGANGGNYNVINTDGIYTARLDVGEGETGYSATIRILSTTNKYVAIARDADADNVGGLGINGMATDNVWSVGEEKTARVYVGDENVYLEPLTAASGVSTVEITNVTLKDASMADAVTINVSNASKIKLTFKSNFYDSVPLEIEYSDGQKEELTIERVGLVIQFLYLDDSGHTEIRPDCKSSGCELDYEYWNNPGDEQTSNEQILIYATYYHPSNDATTGDSTDLCLSVTYDDGNTAIISHTDAAHGFEGYLPASGDEVATTTFIIGFAHAKKQVGYDWSDITSQTFKNSYGSEGGLSVSVLNAGYDDDESFGGTQIGSGAGVYWDGLIEWF